MLHVGAQYVEDTLLGRNKSKASTLPAGYVCFGQMLSGGPGFTHGPDPDYPKLQTPDPNYRSTQTTPAPKLPQTIPIIPAPKWVLSCDQLVYKTPKLQVLIS